MKPGMAAQAGVPPLRGADKAKATNSQGVASAGRRTFTLAPVFASPCGIALDEARGVLYVSEVDAHRVRALRVPAELHAHQLVEARQPAPRLPAKVAAAEVIDREGVARGVVRGHRWVGTLSVVRAFGDVPRMLVVYEV